jgi:RHS repeat-associated protein
MGRFISPDLGTFHFGSPQALNRYTYGLNNPLRFIDLNGKDATDTIEGLWQSWN